MKWSWHYLSTLGKPAKVNKTMALSRLLVARDPQEILSAKPFKIAGQANFQFDKVIVKAHVMGTLVVPSTRSLVPVTLPMNFKFKEIYVKDQNALKLYLQEHPKGDTVLTPNRDREIDFDKSVIDNIILQIPVQVLSSKEKREHLMPKGNGWSVVSEDQYKRSKKQGRKKVDPRLAKLKYYFSKNNKK